MLARAPADGPGTHSGFTGEKTFSLEAKTLPDGGW